MATLKGLLRGLAESENGLVVKIGKGGLMMESMEWKMSEEDDDNKELK